MLRRTAVLCLLGIAVTACNGPTPSAPVAAAVVNDPTPPATVPTPSTTGSAVPSATSAPRRPITLAFGGDVHFEGPVRRHLLADWRTVFRGIGPVLARADLAMVNLETAVTDRGTPEDKQYVFRAPAVALDALREAGIDVATAANNHGIDFGPVGLADTLAAERSTGFPLVGLGRDEAEAYAPYRATLGDWRVAVLGASQVIAPSVSKTWPATPTRPGMASAYRVARLTEAVREARRTSDTVVVYVHWGEERHSCPSDEQRTLAQQLVEAGADVVVGSHAHVVQGAGRMGSSYVADGLGNLLFYSRSATTSVLTLTVEGRRVLRASRTPAALRDGWTTPMVGRAGREETARQEALRACANLS